jgi:PAS domain S-box-containing protein
VKPARSRGKPKHAEQAIGETEERYRRRTVELAALEETAVDLLHHRDLDGVLRAIIERATVVVDVSDAFVSLVEPDGRSSVVRLAVGGASLGLRLGPGEGAVGRTWAERRTIVVNDYPNWPDAIPALVADGMLAVATVPLIVQEKVLGVLGVVHRAAGRTFDDDAVAVLERFAHMASLALENARVAAELGEAEQRYRLLVERLPAIAYLDRVDPEPSTVYVSPQIERILGYQPEDWLGSSERWLAAVHPDDREAAQLAYEDRLRPDRPESHEYRMIARDGRTVWIRDEWETVRDERGEPRFYQGLMYDITERHELEEQLRQAQKMEAVGQLAGGIAHDFNNLLTAMRGYAELLVADLGAGDPRQHDALEIQRAAERASTLTGQLLAFSRRQVLHPRVIELDAAVRGMETFLRRLIGEDVEVVVQTDARGAAVRLDPSQLEQVIVNLAVNARDAMPDGGRLTIATCREKGGDGTEAIMLAVTDTGHGIDAETRVHIFEPFFTTKPRGKGTGMGLATVYGIVEQSGATIDLRTAPGEGTTFEVRFPVLPAVGAEIDLASP